MFSFHTLREWKISEREMTERSSEGLQRRLKSKKRKRKQALMITLTKHDDLRCKQVRLLSSEITIVHLAQRNVETILKCVCAKFAF